MGTQNKAGNPPVKAAAWLHQEPTDWKKVYWPFTEAGTDPEREGRDYCDRLLSEGADLSAVLADAFAGPHRQSTRGQAAAFVARLVDLTQFPRAIEVQA